MKLELVFKLMSAIGFLLSTYLTIVKIFADRVNVKIDVLNIYTALDVHYVNVILRNASSQPVSIVDAKINNLESYKHKVKFVGNSKHSLMTAEIPINIPPKSAINIYLGFQFDRSNPINRETSCSLKLKANKKEIISTFTFKEKATSIETLTKEIEQTSR